MILFLVPHFLNTSKHKLLQVLPVTKRVNWKIIIIIPLGNSMTRF